MSNLPPFNQENPMSKQEILTGALAAREDEVFQYQINIDNYTLALQDLEAMNDPDLAAFEQQLKSLLASERLEQKKAKVMLGVVKKQLEAMK